MRSFHTVIHLKVVQLVVHALTRDELIMVAVLDDSAVLQHKEKIGMANCRQPMGNHEGGAAVHQSLKCIENDRFRFRVDRRGRLVEN